LEIFIIPRGNKIFNKIIIKVNLKEELVPKKLYIPEN